MADRNSSLAALGRALSGQVGGLIRREVQLVRAEMSDKAERAAGGLVSIVVGLLLVLAALLVLLQALVVGLSNLVPAWLAAVIVGAVVALIALQFVRRGRTNLSPSKLAARRTARSLNDDRRTILERST